MTSLPIVNDESGNFFCSGNAISIDFLDTIKARIDLVSRRSAHLPSIVAVAVKNLWKYERSQRGGEYSEVEVR